MYSGTSCCLSSPSPHTSVHAQPCPSLPPWLGVWPGRVGTSWVQDSQSPVGQRCGAGAEGVWLWSQQPALRCPSVLNACGEGGSCLISWGTHSSLLYLHPRTQPSLGERVRSNADAGSGRRRGLGPAHRGDREGWGELGPEPPPPLPSASLSPPTPLPGLSREDGGETGAPVSLELELPELH